MRAASVLGTRFRPPVAAAMAGLPGEQASGIVEALFRADLLRGDDAGWARFRHGLIRQAIYDDLAPPARAYLHERALRTLLIAGAPAGEAAGHAIAAEMFGDAQAIETLTSAGGSALREGAVQAARRYLDAAGRLAGDNAPVALQIDLAKALLASGAGTTATALLDHVLTGPGVPVLTRFSAQLLLGQAAFHDGAVRRAGGLFDAVAAEAGRDHPGVALKALLDHTLQSWARLGPRAALPVASRARGLAAGAGPSQRACAEAAWALCAWLSGDPAGLTAAERAADGPPPTGPAADTAYWGLDPAAVPADIAVWAERFALAERLLTDALRVAEDRAEPFLLFHAALSRSDIPYAPDAIAAYLAADRPGDAARVVGRLASCPLPSRWPTATAAAGRAALRIGKVDHFRPNGCGDRICSSGHGLAGYQL